MTLAQRSESRVGDTAERAGTTPSPSGGRVVGAIDFRQLARRATPPAPLKAEPAGATTPQQQAALNLLSEVSSALPTVYARCQSLEAALSAARDKGRTELEAANEVIREWQGIAESLRVQLESAEKGAAALRARAEAAEAELTTVRGDAERASHAAAEAECLSSLFQEKVISTFGVGTPGHSILESVRNRSHQMLTA